MIPYYYRMQAMAAELKVRIVGPSARSSARTMLGRVRELDLAPEECSRLVPDCFSSTQYWPLLSPG
jgi:hypothetical protein